MMKNKLKSTFLGVLCMTTALGALPPEALAGPMSLASPETVGLRAPLATVHYRRYYGRGYRVGYYYPRRHYYRRAYYGYPGYYGGYYDPSGAIFTAAALGIMGAGIAAATAPRYGYGWGYGWGPGWGWGGPGWGWGGGWW